MRIKGVQIPDWIILLGTLDLVVLALHIFFGESHQLFHLDYEANVPTFFQATKLIFIGVFGLLTGSFSFTTQKKQQHPFPQVFSVSLCILLIAIGLDERYQIHENIYRLFENTPWLHPSNVVSFSQSFGFRSSLWLLYYSPVVVLLMLWLGYWLRELQSRSRSHFLLLLASVVCFLLVISMEVLSSTGEVPYHHYQTLIFLEEASEMLGGTLLSIVLLSPTDAFHNSESSAKRSS